MTAILPVLASVKDTWKVIEDSPTVGKDVLELLGSSMYIDSLSIYREYVQNSADAIEEATALGLLRPGDKGRIDIAIDSQNRTVRVRDNGTGIAKSSFVKMLVGLGASKKRGTKARGFRGVGRLAGLGYCQELVFRSRAEGEAEVSELRWDCRRLKAVLREPIFAGSVEDLIKEVVRVRRFVDRNFPERFFEVELFNIIRHGNDCLINAQKVRNYLSQVAPVPFSPKFAFANEIENALRSAVNLGNISVHLNSSKDPIYRPHANEFEVRKGVLDRFNEIEFFNIQGTNDQTAATGWILHHGYHGAIGNSTLIKGLRLRNGNMQVGEANLLDDLFIEPRFNSWSVGEIHVMDDRILPNGRRDNFEQSIHFNELLNKLAPYTRRLTRFCRVSSLQRNVIRKFQCLRTEINGNLSIIKQGALRASDRKRVEKQTLGDLKQMDKAFTHSALEPIQKARLQKQTARLRKTAEGVFASLPEHEVFRRLGDRDRTLYERFAQLIYECSPNKLAAKQLVDRILAKL
jgi:molecular chaperone HtpG